MNKYIVCALLLSAMILLGISNDVRAASLFGRVIEINDGDAITVFNLNRPVRVRLMGVDAPELGQPFADLARQHLKDLVFDKLVTVEYSGLGANSSIIGRVTVDGNDVCAQMIRDGVAWFDVDHSSRLSDNDREIYRQSELAARGEKRGLWQVSDPVAPWDFVKAQAAQRTSLNSTGNPLARRSPGPGQLTNEHLLATVSQPNSSASPANLRSPVAHQWRQLEPAGANFSVFVPGEGMLDVQNIPFGAKSIEAHSYVARDGWSMYAVFWVTAPVLGETDEAATAGTLAGVLNGLTNGYNSVRDGHKFECDVRSQRNVSASGFSGKEFDLSGCTMPGAARIYTKVKNGERQMIVGVTFSPQPDEGTKRFLQSFKFGQATN